MPKFLLKHGYGLHNLLIFAFIFLLIIVIAFFSAAIAIFSFLILIGLVVYFYLEEKAFTKSLKEYQETLTYRIKKTGDDVISHLPVGIILYNEQKEVEWCNPYIYQLLEQEEVLGHKVESLFPALEGLDLDYTEKHLIQHLNRSYEVYAYGEERMLYIVDVTERQEILDNYHREQIALGIIHMDNYDEASQGMDDQQRAILSSQVTKAITDWATKHNIYIRRHTSDKFIIVFNQGILEELEASRFDILDTVRGMTGENKIPITLSVGVATGVKSLVEMGRLAQASLDIALGRGGDQAAVRVGTRLSFYGGKTNAVEKRTRVRARVISHALRDLIQDSEKVIIMGHTMPDMDAIGASIGVLKAVLSNQKQGFIVLDKINPSIERLMNLIQVSDGIMHHIIKPEEALQLCTPRSLLVVVDTHRPSMTIEPKLLQLTKRVVVIDHHRRAEEFIEDPVLIYLEPYASSTCELVTELLNYQSERLTFEPIEATALLAGIVVDTRSFANRTGARTFEAASYLRRMGADSTLVQRLLKEDLSNYVRRAKLVANSDMVFPHIAIATGDEEDRYDQVLIAQAADTLLDMSGVKASFVIARRQDDQVVISARSLGEINVQVIMEEMGGGGHLNNAATQLKNIGIEEAKKRLIDILKKNEIEGSVEK